MDRKPLEDVSLPEMAKDISYLSDFGDLLPTMIAHATQLIAAAT